MRYLQVEELIARVFTETPVWLEQLIALAHRPFNTVAAGLLNACLRPVMSWFSKPAWTFFFFFPSQECFAKSCTNMQPESKSRHGTPSIHVPRAHTVVTPQFCIVLGCKERMQSITLYLKAACTLNAPLLRTMKVRRGRRGHGESVNDHGQKKCVYITLN